MGLSGPIILVLFSFVTLPTSAFPSVHIVGRSTFQPSFRNTNTLKFALVTADCKERSHCHTFLGRCEATTPPKPAPQRSSGATVLHFAPAVLLVHVLVAWWIPLVLNAGTGRHGREIVAKIVAQCGKSYGSLQFFACLRS